jgi:hypothetical protein
MELANDYGQVMGIFIDIWKFDRKVIKCHLFFSVAVSVYLKKYVISPFTKKKLKYNTRVKVNELLLNVSISSYEISLSLLKVKIRMATIAVAMDKWYLVDPEHPLK